MYIILTAVVVAAASGYAVYRYLRPRLHSAAEIDAATEQKNRELEEINQKLEQKTKELHEAISDLKFEYGKYVAQKQSAQESLELINATIQEAQNTAQTMSQEFYDTHMKHAQEKLEQALKGEAERYQENVQEFLINYQEVVKANLLQRESLREDIARLSAIQTALVEEAKRKEEMETKANFYRIQLSNEDIEEIGRLRAVASYLRDKEPLNKVIWKVYYEKPTNEMIGRVIGAGAHAGIYKITDIASGKCYVGQAVDLASRFKQHIKRGVGAEAPTKNKLYPAMLELGPENFTFEVLEECAKADLDEREDTYQEIYHAKTFGLSIK